MFGARPSRYHGRVLMFWVDVVLLDGDSAGMDG